MSNKKWAVLSDCIWCVPISMFMHIYIWFPKGFTKCLIVGSYFLVLVFFPLMEDLFFIHFSLQRFYQLLLSLKAKTLTHWFPIHVEALYLIFCTRTHHFYLNYSSFHTSFNFFPLQFMEGFYTTMGWLVWLTFSFASPKKSCISLKTKFMWRY